MEADPFISEGAGDMAQGSGYQGTYKVTPKGLAEIVPGKWYYGFTCAACHKRFAVFDGNSSGQRPVTFTGGGHIRVACPHCLADRLYETGQVEHFQAEQAP
jgi:hypothetical protein